MVYVSDLSSEWLESFEAQKIWFERVTDGSKSGKFSDAMRMTYNSNMRQLIRFLRAGGDEGATPDSILKWAKSVEPGEIMKMLKNFSLWLQGEEVEGYERRIPTKKGKYLNEGSADVKAHGSIRGFFTHNQIWLPKMGKRNGSRAKTKKNDVHFSIFNIDPDNPTLIIKDYTQFRLFLGNLNSFRDQTIALCLLSTSQDPGDLLDLNMGFVRAQEGRSRIHWEGVRAKTGEEFRTFFSEEATEHLRQYIAQEREGAGEDEPIFMTRTKYSEAGEPGEDAMSPKAVSTNFLNAAKKMGVVNGKTQSPFRPKRMRSIFSSGCYQAKIDDGARHIFMGHRGTVSESYREMPVANLEQIYARVEPFISVFDEDSSKTRKELSKTQQEVAELKDTSTDTLKLIVKLEQRLAESEKNNKDLREMILGLNSLITEMETQIAELVPGYGRVPVSIRDKS